MHFPFTNTHAHYHTRSTGIFLALLSPFIKLIKIIFGDLTGLIGGAFGLAAEQSGIVSRFGGAQTNFQEFFFLQELQDELVRFQA